MFEEIIECQEKKLLRLAREIIPNVTRDDIMQPNDFPELENHPIFRYEEGILAGLRAAQIVYFSAASNKSFETV